jgi:NDP-sugar pyrophosphorylase family protein
LAPIAGRPFLDYLLADIAGAGVRKVVLCAGYKADMIQTEYGDSAFGISIRYSVEERPMGTAGALRLAGEEVSADPFLLLNGDSIAQVDYRKLAFTHAQSVRKATLTLTRLAEAARYDIALLGPNGEIGGFVARGDARATGQDGSQLINAGVYAINRCVLDSIPTAAASVSLEHDILPGLLGNGLFGFVSEGFFIDIGVPEDYARAQNELPRRFHCAGSHSC